MLTVTKLADAEYTLTQVAQGIEEYYLGIGESPGVWDGRWAAQLGLEGVVDGDHLRALLDGRDPSSGQDLLAGRPERTVKAFDCTFSAPKSVSLLWAMGSPQVSSVISIAHTEAVASAVRLLESKAAVARQQTDGVRARVGTEGFAVAAFTHRTSRDGDPQLHTHCVVPNVARRPDGTHVAIAGEGFWEWKKAVGSVYQEQLRRLLTQRLGVEWGTDRNGCREMLGFTQAQLRTFSKRTAQIEARLEAAGVDPEDRVAWMRADDKASLATRPAKDKTLTPARLERRWADEAARAGIPMGVALDAGVTGHTVERRSLDRDEVFARLVDPEHGLCARRARFGPADVVEHVAALGAGQLTVEQITELADAFLASELAVRLIDRDPTTGRTQPRCWSTAAHLALERHVLGRLDQLAAVEQPGTDPHKIEAAIVNSGRLGADQAAAVRVLCGPGAAVRALVAPAGYGKTTTVQVAAAAQEAAGRPVVAVASTNQAVHELRNVGLEASTIARLRLDLEHDLLPVGAVLVVDEISQVATADAAWLFDVASSIPGGQLWLLGDSRQTGPVRAGGLAHEIERLAGSGAIPAATLLENRRQRHAAERNALERFRAGDPAASQSLRADHGWEHQHDHPEATRHQMATAVAEDIARLGADQVVVLAVAHADCEDLADRIRAEVFARGKLGPAVATGPAWGGGEREYAVGDRILIHANQRIDGHRWHNGTVVSVTGAAGDGVTVTGPPDPGGSRPERVLPRWFVAGRRADGAPNVSHAWARTIDGAQGGTWTQVHLLATAALDATTGYVGQSRGRLPTHTWNVAPPDDGDHGGIIAGRRDPADQALAAMARIDEAGFAATDDPFWLDHQLTAERAEHQAVIDARPRQVLPLEAAAARSSVDRARRRLEEAEWRLGLRHEELDAIGPLARLTRNGRQRNTQAENALSIGQRAGADARAELARQEQKAEAIANTQAAGLIWQHDHGWRISRVAEIDHQLDQHWARAVIAAARAGDPLAFGLDRLRAARHTTLAELRRLQAAIPPDNSQELARAQADLAHRRANRQWAERQLQGAESRVAELHAGPRWRNRSSLDQAEHTAEEAAAELRQATTLEQNATDAVERHGRTAEVRQRALDDTAKQRHELFEAARQLGAVLNRARADRVIAAARGEVGHEHLYQTIGLPPRTRGGLAAWCALADRIETANDNTQPDRRDQTIPDDPTERIARRLQSFADSASRDSRLIAHAPEIIDNAERLDPRIAPDPAALDSRYCGQMLDQAVALQNTRAVERGHGIELGL